MRHTLSIETPVREAAVSMQITSLADALRASCPQALTDNSLFSSAAFLQKEIRQKDSVKKIHMVPVAI